MGMSKRKVIIELKEARAVVIVEKPAGKLMKREIELNSRTFVWHLLSALEELGVSFAADSTQPAGQVILRGSSRSPASIVQAGRLVTTTLGLAWGRADGGKGVKCESLKAMNPTTLAYGELRGGTRSNLSATLWSGLSIRRGKNVKLS